MMTAPPKDLVAELFRDLAITEDGFARPGDLIVATLHAARRGWDVRAFRFVDGEYRFDLASVKGERLRVSIPLDAEDPFDVLRSLPQR